MNRITILIHCRDQKGIITAVTNYVASIDGNIIYLDQHVDGDQDHSSFNRGVKIIGATSHYVTDELDEVPIIEQDITRATHSQSIEDFIMKGKDLERMVLARTIKLHAERKTMVYNNKTVVFA